MILPQPGCEPAELFGNLIRVRQCNDVRARCTLRLEQQSFTEHTRQHRPTHRVNREALRLADLARSARAADELKLLYRHLRVHRADDSAQALTIRRDGFLVSLGRGEVAIPKLRARGDRSLQLPLQKRVDS